jgi:hypothetical protein
MFGHYQEHLHAASLHGDRPRGGVSGKRLMNNPRLRGCPAASNAIIAEAGGAYKWSTNGKHAPEVDDGENCK